MEPRIQYAKTSDGVSIAYYRIGEGPPLVWSGGYWGSHLSEQWRIADGAFRPPSIERLAESFTVLRYDGRGSGLSQREPHDFSLEARLRDLDAISDRSNVRPVALFGQVHAALAAIAYAAKYPDRVSALIVRNPFPRGDELYEISPTMKLVAALGEVTADQWEFVTLTIAQRGIGVEDASLARELARLNRESMTPDALLAFREATRRIDVTELLPTVSVPTLVLHRTGDFPLQFSQEVASMIPDAQLQVRSTTAMLSDEEADAIAAFLGVEAPGKSLERVTPTAGSLATILFTDLTSSTALTQRLGDAKAQELVRAHNAIVRDALRAQGGTEIKHTGDGIMASFPSASGALECAVAIQRGVEARGDANLSVHIGLNAGEPVADEGDLFGTAVQLARRICDHASGGEILASDVVRQLAAGKGFLFADRGEVIPKGFDEAVRLYEVRWRAEGSPQETGA